MYVNRKGIEGGQVYSHWDGIEYSRKEPYDSKNDIRLQKEKKKKMEHFASPSF